jgi:chromate transporter
MADGPGEPSAAPAGGVAATSVGMKGRATLPPGAAPGPASARELFLACQRLALQGFGGVLPVAQHELVERRGWLTRADFVDLLAVAQVLPGPNIVNLVMIYGDRCFGWRGAFAAAAGVLAAPLVVVLVAAVAFAQATQWPAVAGALRGMGAVAAGLIVATALRLAGGLAAQPLGPWRCALLGAAAFIGVGVLRWPLVAVLGLLGPVACAWAWWRLPPPAQAADAEGQFGAAGPAPRPPGC